MIYRFDQFEVDGREFRFSDGLAPVSVEPKALRLLIYLIQNRNRLVPKQELLDKVWPDAVVTENVLTREVVLLRKALKEDSRSPRYIETVPTVGYRFVAKVTEVDRTAADGAALDKSALIGRKHSRAFVIASVLLLGGVAALLLSVGLRLREGAPPEDLRPVPLISTGNSCCPSFSPDGTKMVFGWTGEQDANWEIYVKQIGAPGNPIKLTKSPPGVYRGAVDPVWSPDDRWIAYRRNRADGADLMLVPPLGGPERWVANLPRTAAGSGWTPDGKWLAFPQMDSPLGSSIWAISIDTGERRQLTTFAARAGEGRYPLGDSLPSFSPDGRSLAFCRKVHDSVYELYVQPLTRDLRPDGEARQVSDRPYANFGGPSWTRDGRDLVYSAGMPEFLWRVGAFGRQTPRRLGYPAAALGPAMAGTPPRLAYVWWLTNVNLWRLDVRTGERTPLIRSAPSVFDRNIRPQFSPDGHKIAFDSFRTGDLEVWTCDVDGTNCQQITKFQGPWGGNPRWSPDSRSLAFDSRASGSSEIYVVAADGGSPRRLTNSPDSKILPSWSHDGRWIYFASDRTGRYEVWRMPRDGGEAIQLTHAGGVNTFESPDGKYLYYTKFNLKGPIPLFRMPAGGGEEVLIVPGIESSELVCVTAKGVYFVPPRPAANTIQFLDAASGKVSKLTTMDEQAAGAYNRVRFDRAVTGGLAVSPDDAYVVWSQMDRETTNLMLVEGFR
jgi:Tol biopolymer transport system component/DNA-binding winged helix-turn-helix (wHTH) protein